MGIDKPLSLPSIELAPLDRAPTQAPRQAPSPRKLRAIIANLRQLEGELDITESELSEEDEEAQSDTLQRIAHIRDEMISIISAIDHDPQTKTDCEAVISLLQHIADHVAELEDLDPLPPHQDPDKADKNKRYTPAEHMQEIIDHLHGLEDDHVHVLEKDSLQRIRSRKILKKRALKVAGTVSGLIGVTLMGAGGALGAIGFAGLASVFGTAPAVGILVGAGAAESLGIAMAGGTGAAIYYHQRIEPSSKEFVRKYSPDQMDEASFNIGGLNTVTDYEQRRKIVRNWAKNSKVKIDKEEQYWYACKDNFGRWLDLKKINGSKEHRQDLVKLMKLERKNALWGCHCPNCV